MRVSRVTQFRRTLPRTKLLSVGLAAWLALAGPALADAAPDAWVSTKVRSSLLTAEGLSSRRIHVDTLDGRVTLFGTVTSEAQRAQAEEIARKVDGATSVRNLLQLVSEDARKSTALADRVIEKNVTTALKADPALADSQIKVRSVDKALVLLTGSAKTLSDHVRALEIAARQDGVRQVASEVQSPNRLGDAEIWRDGAYDPKVATSSSASDTWVTTAVKLRLLANTQTPGFDINVDTHRGVVTLFGVVDSEKVRADAEAEARKVDGTKAVQNELQVVTPAKQAGAAENDDAVQRAVERRLTGNTELSDASLKLAVKNGVVRVTGTVASQMDRLTALTLVRTTKGVRGVLDEMSVAAR